MTFEEAVVKAMRVYWKDTKNFDGLTTSKNRKYNKAYFDGVEAEMLSPKDQSKNNKAVKEQKGKIVK